jgi:addiction module HigA family antidote
MNLDRESMPPSPSVVLKAWIGERTQEEVAAALKTTRYTVNQLVNGKRSISPDMALRLAQAFHTSPEYWMELQAAVDLYKSRQKITKILSKIPRLR